HLQIIRQRPRPQGRTDMHVPGQRGRAAIAAELGGGEAVCLEIGPEAALLLRHADGKEAFRVHVAKILERKARLAVVLGGPRLQHAAPEPPRLFDQRGLKIVEAERGRGKDWRLDVVRVDTLRIHYFTPAPAILPPTASSRKAKIAASNACGASRLARWPTPGKQTYRA